MTYRVVLTANARKDLKHLYRFLERRNPEARAKARAAIRKSFQLLADFPFTCRKASPKTSFLRELVIDFGSAGHVALFEIEDTEIVRILAVRHQREGDYF